MNEKQFSTILGLFAGLSEQIAALRSDVNELKERMDRFEARMNTLEGNQLDTYDILVEITAYLPNEKIHKKAQKKKATFAASLSHK